MSLGETHSTLSFAQRAKNVKNRPVINEAVGGTVLELQTEILRLRREILRMKAHSQSVKNIPKASSSSSSSSTEEPDLPMTSDQQFASANSTDSLLLEDAYRLRRTVLGELKNQKTLSAALRNQLQSLKMVVRLRDAQIKSSKSTTPSADDDSETAELKKEVELLRQQVKMPPDAITWRRRFEEAKAKLTKCQDAASTIAMLEVCHLLLPSSFWFLKSAER